MTKGRCQGEERSVAPMSTRLQESDKSRCQDWQMPPYFPSLAFSPFCPSFFCMSTCFFPILSQDMAMAHGCGQLDVFTAVRNCRKAAGHPMFLFFILWLFSPFLPFLFCMSICFFPVRCRAILFIHRYLP